MANTLELRGRIKTAQNISKTTRAMQMIAASRLKKAQEAAVSSRPYVTKLMDVSKSIIPSNSNDASSAYIQIKKKSNKSLYVIISPDKGLCGGLVTNLSKEYLKYKNDNNSFFITVGKKIEGIISSTSKNLIASFAFGNVLPSFAAVLPLINLIDSYFLSGKVDKVFLITTHFNSVFSQTPKITQLLPVEIVQEKATLEKLFEPSQEELLPALLKRYIEMVLFQHLLESYASEQAARMFAMQNATNNAKDIVSTLKLLYNKARQEKITNEILDISSAAVAMESFS